MRELFLAIRHNDIQLVKDLIGKKPELIHCTAKQPPKKDDGQSPLQIALKTGNFDIADYLLDMGADPNFMEAEDCCFPEQRAPALHDAINAAVMESRWSVDRQFPGEPAYYKEMSQPDVTERAYQVLERMIKLGGDVNKLDSLGNNSIWRFCLSANQILPRDDNDRTYKFSDELHEDLMRILSLLKSAGADFNVVRPDNKLTVVQCITKGGVKILLDSSALNSGEAWWADN